MLNQRESDIAHVEAKLEIQKLLEEWVKDYLGNRYGDNRGQGEQAQAEGAGAGGPAGAIPPTEGAGGQPTY